MSFHHRSNFKVPNKPFKGKSKGKVKKKQGGKVERPILKSSNKEDVQSKQKRYNKSKQQRQQKKEDILFKKRIGSRAGPAKIVGIISLGAAADLAKINLGIKSHSETLSPVSNPMMINSSIQIGKQTQKFIFYQSSRDPVVVLDIAKAADALLLVVNPDPEFDTIRVDVIGEHIIRLLKAQGLPTVIGVLQGLSTVSVKRQAKIKKAATKYFHSMIDDTTKVVQLDHDEEYGALFRLLANTKNREILWRQHRAYLMGEQVVFTSNPKDPENGELRVAGHFRGDRILTANQLIHLTGVGDFQIARLEGLIEEEDGKTVIGNTLLPDAKQESLQDLVPIDPLAHEQSIITDEELKDAEKRFKERKAQEEKKRQEHVLVSGVSEYQKLWDELAAEEEGADDEDRDRDIDAMSEAPAAAPAVGGGERFVDMAQKKKLERDDVDWFDEVDTPRDVVLRDRFAKYRGLKSIKESPWDPKENLPLEYSQIFQFADLANTKRAIMQDTDALMAESLAAQEKAEKEEKKEEEDDEEEDDSKMKEEEVGELSFLSPYKWQRVAITLTKVPAAQAAKLMEQPVLLWGLYPYEHKISVMHFLVKRHPEYTAPVKMKETLDFHVGFRRFTSRPIFSQHLKGATKYLCERFLHQGRFSVASVYTRVMFAPAPVLIFKPTGAAVDPRSLDSPMSSELLLAPSASAMLKPASRSRSRSGSQSGGDRSAPRSRRGSVTSVGSVHSEGKLSVAESVKMSSRVPLPLGVSPLVASGSILGDGPDPDRLLIKRIILTGAPIAVHGRKATIRHMFFHPDDVRWFKPVELWTKLGLKGIIKEPHGTKGYMRCLFESQIKGNDTVCLSLYKRQYPPWDSKTFA